MRRDKVATRILLILSVVHATAAAPAIILQRSVEVTKDVRPGLEKHSNSDDESSNRFPRMDDNLPSTSGTLPSQDDTSAAPGEPELHSDPPLELGNPQLHNDQLPAPPAPPPSSDDTLPGSGTLHLQDEASPAPGDPGLHSDSPPELGTPQLHIDQEPTSGTPQLHNDQPPTPGASPSQDYTSSALEDPQLHNDPLGQHSNWSPGEMLQGESSGTAEIPSLHHYQSWLEANRHPLQEMLQGDSSGTPPLDDDPWWHTNHVWFWHHTDLPSPVPMLQSELWGAPPEPDDLWWEHASWDSPADTLYEGSSETSSTMSGAPELQDDLPPAWGSPQVHDGPPPALGTSQLHDGGSEELDYLNR